MNFYGTWTSITPVARRGFTPPTRKDRPGIALNVAACTVNAVFTRAAYMVAVAVIPPAIGDLTVLSDKFFPELPDTINLCVAATDMSTDVTVRYRLTPLDRGELPFANYAGELLTNPAARIELWVSGDVAQTINVPAFTVTLGNRTETQTSYDLTPCVITTTGDSGFAAYMSACPTGV